MKRILMGGLSTLLLATAVTNFNVQPASALPGQNVTNFLRWAQSRPLPRKLTYSSEARGYSGNKGNLHFYAGTTNRNGVVTREGMTVSYDTKIQFSRHNPAAIQFIQRIYGTQIANDFKNSQFIEKVGRDSFLRGRLYAYSVAQVQDGTNMEIFLLRDLRNKISNAKYCQTHQCDV